MRRAHKYLSVPAGSATVGGIPTSAEEFANSIGYRHLSGDELLASARLPWVTELHETLTELLSSDRTVLSLGSGQGEHELLLFLDGYDVTASDLIPGALEDARLAFPGFKTRVLDALDPPTDELYDDVLATGLDYALNEAQLQELLAGTRRLLRPGGRFILVLRFHDNLVSRILDDVLVPIVGLLSGLVHWLRRDGLVTVRREHGYRRTRDEIHRHAEAAGYEVASVCYSCFALELARIPTPKLLLRIAHPLDRRLHAFNSATIFELRPVAGA
jgi:SAM-dependent methyltransferase